MLNLKEMTLKAELERVGEALPNTLQVFVVDFVVAVVVVVEEALPIKLHFFFIGEENSLKSIYREENVSCFSINPQNRKEISGVKRVIFEILANRYMSIYIIYVCIYCIMVSDC